jgi:hypothetical protein
MDRAGFVDPRDPGRDLRAEQEGLAILKSGCRPITREKFGECSLESEQPDEGATGAPNATSRMARASNCQKEYGFSGGRH